MGKLWAADIRYLWLVWLVFGFSQWSQRLITLFTFLVTLLAQALFSNSLSKSLRQTISDQNPEVINTKK